MNMLIACFCAFILGYGLTYLLRRFLASRLGLIDVPNDGRRMHETPTPLGGGLAVFVSFIIASIVEYEHLSYALPYIIGGAIIVACGVCDDLFSIKPIIKIACQAAAGVALCFFGVTFDTLCFFGVSFGTGIFAYPLTVLWVIAVTNAFNLIDGLDGLCTGISIISGCGVIILALIGVRSEMLVCAVLFVLACAGFIPHNKYKAKIFLGDTGSMFLGFMLSALTVDIICGNGSAVQFPTLLSVALVGIPVFDTVYAIVRRVYRRKSIFSGDKNHVHHILCVKYSHSVAVVLMCLGAVICDGIALLMTGGLIGEIIGYLLFLAAIAYGVVRFGVIIKLQVRKQAEKSKNSLYAAYVVSAVEEAYESKMAKKAAGEGSASEAESPNEAQNSEGAGNGDGESDDYAVIVRGGSAESAEGDGAENAEAPDSVENAENANAADISNRAENPDDGDAPAEGDAE